MSSTTQILIQQASILLANSEFFLGDIRLSEGKITQIADHLQREEEDRVIDARGLTLLPGVIDPQVHFREPGLEHKEDLFTATCACAREGSLLSWKCLILAL